MSNINSWKNYYAIDLIDTVANNIKYAKQMGHDYIAIKGGTTPANYINNPDCVGLKFYINNVMVERTVFSGYPGFPTGYYPLLINVNAVGGHNYTQAQKDWYSSHMVWGYSNKAWPFNFATGYHSPSTDINAFTVVWDFQQQVVIDEIVEKIIIACLSYQNLSLPFTFAGYIIDTPRLQGPFFFLNPMTLKVSVATIKDWTGTTSGLLHSGITHEYPTFVDGMAAFYKKLNRRMREEFPNNNTKWIVDPYELYNKNPINFSEFIFSIKDRSDKVEMTPDMLTQEGHITDFVDNPLNFNSGVNIAKDMVGCSQSSAVEESVNRLIAAKAGINGAWYVWFLMFGSSGNMPKFQSVAEVYPRLKLVRCIPNWDNLNSIPLSQRYWVGSVYKSGLINTAPVSFNSYISTNLMYTRHWKTQEIYIVFNTNTESIVLSGNPDIKRVDGFFAPTVSGLSDFNKVGDAYTLKNTVVIPLGGIGYIVTGSSNSIIVSGGFIFGGSCKVDAFHAVSNREITISGGFLLSGILSDERVNIHPIEYSISGGFLLGGSSEVAAFSASSTMDVDTFGGFILGGVSQVDGLDLSIQGGFILGGYMNYEYINYPRETQHKGRITGMVFRRIQKP